MATLLWFRRDLRLSDNLALLAAINSGPVIPVFITAADEDAPWQPGARSRWWLGQSLRALDQELRSRGSRLIVREGPTTEALQTLMAETGATAIFSNRLHDAKDKLATGTFPGYLLFEPSAIAPRRVFTAFWKACLHAAPPAAPLPAPDRIPAPARWPSSVSIEAGGRLGSWQPGEAGALAQIRHFHADAYAIERDRPDLPGTSRLSPHLHFGEITPRQVWKLGNEAFQRQLIWREFAHHLLYHFPYTPLEPLRPEFARFPWHMSARHFKAWTEGRTGYPLVDAGMRELLHTGWMHNRVRMVAASFLVKHLLIPWQEGARWFWDRLVDADLANNTLGWQWAAGCGADAAPYFRIFNPTLQAEKFDPHGDYIRRWAPERITPIIDHHTARARALQAFSECKPSRLPVCVSAPRRPNRPAKRTETDLLF